MLDKTKVTPYVYKCTHKTTNEFYIGCRYSKDMKQPPEIDITIYKTSSTRVRASFDEFVSEVIAVFNDQESAYDFEQQLIYESWDDPLLINESCYHQKRRFKTSKSSTAAAQKSLLKNYNVTNAGQTIQSREAASQRFKSDLNPAYHQSQEKRDRTRQTILGHMDKLTSEEKSLKFGNFGDNNPFKGKTHPPELQARIAKKTSETWKNKKSIWMHDTNNKNIRVCEVDIADAIDRGCVRGYAPGTHPRSKPKI